MKKSILSILVVLLLLATTACGQGNTLPTSSAVTGGASSSASSSTAAGGEADSFGGVVRAAVSSDAPTLDPQGKTPNTFSSAVADHLFEGLVRTRGNDVLPGIAETWEISANGLVYTFHLRNAEWSDGVAVTANDFVTGARRLVDPLIASNNASFGYYIVNGEAVNNGDVPAEELGVKALDEKTVEITLAQPVGYYLTLLGQLCYLPVRADIVDKYGAEFASSAETNVYNGPFVLDDWQLENHLTLSKNASYWNADEIKLDGVEFVIISNSETAAAMFDAGQVDFVYQVDSAIVPLYQDKVQSYVDGGINFARFNLNGENPITANKNFRAAFNAAFDREEFIALFSNGLNESNSRIVFPYVNGTNGDYGSEYPLGYPVTANLEQAKTYLDDALKELNLNSPSDITVELLVKDFEANRKEATIIQDMMLNNLGINLTVRTLPNAEWLVEHREHTYDIIMAAWSPDYNDPLTYTEVYLSNSSYNHASYHNSAFDALVNEANLSSDPKVRLQKLAEAEQILLDDVVAVPTYLTQRIYLQAPRLQNVFLGFQSSSPDFVYAYYTAQ